MKKIEISPLIAAVVFTSFLLIFESFIFDTGYKSYFDYLQNTPDRNFQFSAIVLTLGAIGCFFIFTLYAFSSELKYKIVYFLFLTFTMFYEYGYQKAVGRFSNWSDVDATLRTNLGHKTNAIATYFNFESIIAAAVFLLFLIISKPAKPYKFRGLLTVFGLLGIFFFNVSYINDFFADQKFPTVSMNAFCRSSMDFLYLGDILDGSAKVRKKVAEPNIPKDQRPHNNIVLVVDESILGNHLSLNGYERPTTPFLETLAKSGVLHNFGIAVSATTASHTTYDVLMTGTMPDEFPDRRDSVLRKSPTIFQYAKAMNYKTHFLDGQMISYWGGIPDDMNYIDEFVGVNKIGNPDGTDVWNIDERIAQRVNKIVTESTGNFIFVFKHGSHIPYFNNFPEEATYWQLSSKGEVTANFTPEQREMEVNAYDNSLKYNIDRFFQNLITDYSNIPNNTAVIYTGDHGQTLYANGVNGSHAGRTKAEANVPLFIIGNLPQNIDANYKASHANILPTVLDFLNFPEDKRYKKYAPSLLKATAADNQPRYFNPSLEAKVPFDE